MKTKLFITLILLLLGSSLYAQPAVTTEFLSRLDEATDLAQKEDKNILLVFSGSDWCKPCILLKREVLHSAAFAEYAAQELVLVNLDFPALRKNKLSPEQEAYNASLADRLNPEGKFPRVVLLDSQGQVLREVDYHSGMTADAFLRQIENNL